VLKQIYCREVINTGHSIQDIIRVTKPKKDVMGGA